MLVYLVYMENSCYLMSHCKGLMILDILWQTVSTSYKIEIHGHSEKFPKEHASFISKCPLIVGLVIK